MNTKEFTNKPRDTSGMLSAVFTIASTGKREEIMEKNNLQNKYKVAIFSILLILVFTSLGLANTFYVSTTGNDSNPGTFSSPWRTIQKGADTVVAGDTLIVNAGNFASERVQVTKSGSAGAPITYQTQGTVVMKGFSIYADYITIKGFEITDTDNDNTDGYGVFIRKANNCVIEENYIHYATRGGITMWAPPGEGTSISNCIIRNNRLYKNQGLGIDIQGRNHLVENNEIWSTIQYHPKWVNPPSYVDADGMHFHGSGHIIRENYIHDINQSDPENIDPHIDAFQTWSSSDREAATDIIFEQNHVSLMSEAKSGSVTVSSFMLAGANNITIKNNLLESWSGINTGGGGNSNLKIYNNTFRSSLSFNANYWPRALGLENVTTAEVYNNITIDYSWAHYSVNGGSNINYDYNLMWNSNGSTPALSGYTAQSHDKRGVDPKFVANFADLHLQSTSPAIDAGTTISTVTNDYNGNPRPQGAGFDIGAYETTGNTSPPNAPKNFRLIN